MVFPSKFKILNLGVVVFPSKFKILNLGVVVFPSKFKMLNLEVSGFSFQFVKSYHNLTIFCIKVSILNFSKECHYLENKVGVVDFTKARGMVKFQSPRALAGPWALKHYHSLGICKIYYSHFIFEVMYHTCTNAWNFSGKIAKFPIFHKYRHE